jgi:hypothetical protein
MGRVLPVVLLLVAAQAAGASGGPPRALMRTTVTGEIRQLGLQKIAVGQIACTIPTKLSLSADRFVIGDPVRLSCLGGKLVSLRYSPEIALNQSSKPGTGNAPPTVTTPRAPCGSSCAAVSVYSIGTLFLGGGPTGDTSTVTGAITDISDGSITAGGLTCSFKPSFDSLFDRAAHVGDNVTLTCTAGVFVAMKSVGPVPR